MIQEVFPRVYRSGCSQRIFLKLAEHADQEVSVRIFGMERYTVPHSPLYRIDEYDRHPFRPMEHLGEGLYSAEYDFPFEQRYRLWIKVGDTIISKNEDLYAVDADLAALRALKGDTHLHSNRSDGEDTPFAVGLDYRRAGFDFIALTDHHRMWPSVEAKEAFEKLTEAFTVIRAEEVHNRDMGYFHIVNLNGSFSVNDYIEEDQDRAAEEVRTILQSNSFPEDVDAHACAYRKFIADKIHEGGGLAIMAHPFWICYDEYNVQYPDLMYAWRNRQFDALEVLAGNPQDGDNLTAALWADLRAEGVRIPVVGASDAHSCTKPGNLFNEHFSLVFARNSADILPAIREERTVAVSRRADDDFFVFGSFRLVKYARFLLELYFPAYQALTKAHADAMARAGEQGRTAEIAASEEAIQAFQKHFFA